MGESVVWLHGGTAIAQGDEGALSRTPIYDLGRTVIAEAVKRSGTDPAAFDDVIMGEVLHGGGDLARYCAIELGMIDVPGLALMRACASGLQAANSAAASIKAGMDRAVVAGGLESMSSTPVVTRGGEPWMS